MIETYSTLSPRKDYFMHTSPSPEGEEKPFIPYPDRSRGFTPIHAPIQKRAYCTPSKTSRKDFPANLTRRSSLTPSFFSTFDLKGSEDERDQLIEEAVVMDNDTMEQMLEKRRRNTLSARKSRMKKMKQMQDLEQERDNLLKLAHDYRHYVAKLQHVLAEHGIRYDQPSFNSL